MTGRSGAEGQREGRATGRAEKEGIAGGLPYGSEGLRRNIRTHLRIRQMTRPERQTGKTRQEKLGKRESRK